MAKAPDMTAEKTLPTLHFRLPVDPGRLQRARERIRDYLHSQAVAERSSREVATAIEEAMTNVVRHSGSPNLEVVLRFEGADLIAEIRDQGSARNWSAAISTTSSSAPTVSSWP